MSRVSYTSLCKRTDLISRWRIALISVLVVTGFTSQAIGAPPIPVSLPPVEAKPDKGKKLGNKLGKKMGRASWYGPRFHGKKTASGERFNQNSLTAAHRSLPLGTRVEVTNLKNGRKVKVRINDRGPYAKGRTIDLSRAAAQQLGIIAAGTAPVRIELHAD